MSDMNFFSSYNKKIEKKENRKPISLVDLAAILILLVILIYGTFNLVTINRLSNDIQALNTELETARKDPKLAEVRANEKQISAINAELSKLNQLDKKIDGLDKVNEYVLKDIRSNTPPELFLRYMIMNQDGIKIQGASKDRDSIAQFAHDLREIKGLEKLYIPFVTDENEHYSYFIDIDLKEEKTDGAKAGK